MKNFKIILLVGLILIITFAAFYPCLKNGFTNWDDDLYVTNNPVIKSFSPQNIKQVFTSFFVGNYQPVTMLSYLFEYQFIQLNPFGYHLTNLILHLLNCLLVFWLIYILTGSISVSWITAILFSLHPLHVESVAWVSERKDVLYALFFLAGIICYCYYLRAKRRGKYYFMSLILFIFSLLSKSMAMTLPLVLLLIDYLNNRKVNKRMFLDKVPFFILSFVFGALAVFGQYSGGFVRKSISSGAFSILTVPSYSILFYLNKIFLPVNLSCFYPQNWPGGMVSGLLYFCILMVLFFGVIFSGKYTKKIVFGSLFFLTVALPILQFIPIGETIVADRYVYLASIGVFYLFAEGYVWLYRKKKPSRLQAGFLTLLFVLIVMILGALTQSRCRVWKDSVVLWNNALKDYPDAVTAYNNRGTELLARKEYNLADADFTKAIKINPNYSKAYYNRGVVYYEQNNFSPALLDFNKAIEINPGYFDAYYNRGLTYYQQNNFTQAIADFNKAIEINPGSAGVYNNRGVVYFLEKEYALAWADVHKAGKLGYAVNPEFITELKKASGINE
jgi:Tfp pilus assembly protein PilF